MLVKVVTKAGVVDMEATEVVGTTTIEVAAGSEVVGTRDSPRESPLNMSEQSPSPRPMWNHPVQYQNHAMISLNSIAIITLRS
jgi:hypothetical protein